MEKNLLTKTPTLISAKLLTYQTDTINSQSSSIFTKSDESPESKTDPIKNREILLKVDHLAFTNKCLILDDEDNSSQVAKFNEKNYSIV